MQYQCQIVHLKLYIIIYYIIINYFCHYVHRFPGLRWWSSILSDQGCHQKAAEAIAWRRSRCAGGSDRGGQSSTEEGEALPGSRAQSPWPAARGIRGIAIGWGWQGGSVHSGCLESMLGSRSPTNVSKQETHRRPYPVWLLMYTVYQCIIPIHPISTDSISHDATWPSPHELPRHQMKICRAAAAGGIPAASSSFALQADIRGWWIRRQLSDAAHASPLEFPSQPCSSTARSCLQKTIGIRWQVSTHCPEGLDSLAELMEVLSDLSDSSARQLRC